MYDKDIRYWISCKSSTPQCCSDTCQKMLNHLRKFHINFGKITHYRPQNFIRHLVVDIMTDISLILSMIQSVPVWRELINDAQRRKKYFEIPKDYNFHTIANLLVIKQKPKPAPTASSATKRKQ